MITARNQLSPVRIVESDDPARLAALRSEWSELFQAGGAGNPFLSWEWQYTFWRAFAQRRPLWILEARDRGERLAGLLVLCGRPALGGARRFCLLSNGITGTDGLDVLARPGFGPAVREALARAVADAMPRWDLLDLEDLPCGSATISALRAALLSRGGRAYVEPRFVCPSFALRGSYVEHLSRFRRRETYLRRRRWLERQPGFAVSVAETPAEAPEAMEDFLRLHRLRWKRDGGSEGIPPGPVEDFHRDLAPLLAARGWLRLYRMHVGGRSIAAVYGLELSGRFYYYQSGMDPEWNARSPGLVLIGKTVEDAYARRLTDYDFLRGAEPHKLEWASDRRETCALRLRAPGLRSDAGAAAEEVFRMARDAARAIAPERMWSVLRRMKRSVVLGELGLVGAEARRAERGGGAEAEGRGVGARQGE